MSDYYGDIQLGDTIQWTFTTVGTDGAPTVLTGSPTATAYTDGGVTQSATGVTLTADFDSVVGLNLVSVVATGGNGFAAGENIEIVLDAGTVGGTTVIGYAVGSFSVENRSNLRSTTVGQNEVDVTATGAVGIDWNNIENPTTAQNLSGTNIDVDQIVASVSGNVDGSVASVSGAVGSVTGSVGSNVELGPAEVNAEVVDVLFTDTDAEPVKGLPGATIPIADKIGFLYKAWRNRSTQNATTYSLYNDDATTVDHDATVSDDTTTADRGEMTDGP